MFLSEIERFLVLADSLNYTTAAAKLFISQPTLSTAIATLERDLGCKLFRRSTKSVELTKEGVEFYYLCKKFIGECNKLNRENIENTPVSGNCSIFYDRSVDYTHLPFLFSTFKQQNPAMSVTTRHKSTHNTIQALWDGKIDIGICNSFSIPPDGFDIKPLFPYSLQILVWNGHPLCTEKSIKLRDLMSEPFIILDPSVSNGSKLILSLCTAAGLKIKESIHAANFRQMLMMTAQKEGISFNLTNEVSVAEYWDLRIVNVDISDCFPQPAGMVAAWKSDNKNPSIQCFVKTVNFLHSLTPLTIKIADV